MRKVFISLMFIAAIAMASCHNKPGNSNQGTLILKFNPMFGANQMHLFTTYTAPDGKYYNFQDFKVYLSRITLIYTNGTTVDVDSLAYFSLDDSADVSVSIPAPIGSFKGIQFNIGLDSVWNNNPMFPSTDTSSPVSSNKNTFWNMTTRFVFIEIDGTADTTRNSSNVFAYHVGTDPYYTAAPPLYQNFTISGGGQTALTLTADVQKLFYGNNSLNILTDPITMTTGSPYAQTLAHTFMNDFTQIFSLQ
jgi:hypothetical protein